jgi:AraC family ethanolamine operon transcriptional activator
MSPMAYFKCERLNGVRRALKAADPRAVTVAELARRWGF